MRFSYFICLTLIVLSCTNNDKMHQKTIGKSSIENLKIVANKYYDSNAYVKAIMVFEKIISLDSTNGEYYFKRGYSYSMILNPEQAIRDYSKSISLGYKISSAYKNIGINYSTINDTLAIINFNKSLEYETNLDERKKISLLIDDCNKRLKNETQYIKRKTI